MTGCLRLHRAGLLAVLVAVLALLGGCVSLPHTGPVRSGPAQAQPDVDAPFEFNPAGPQRGATPIDIVNGFLLAMQATPLRTDIARQFLTTESRGTWAPEHGTVVYRRSTLTSSETKVSVRLDDTDLLDGRGQWLGDPSGGTGVQYHLDLVREKGQWRISNPPDALIVPRSHFEQRFSQYFLYFFDKSSKVLVPEPVYLPRGEQAPTLLVRGLLRGVDQRLLGTERTFIPPKTELDLSVPVSRDGTAEVPLSDQVVDLPRARLGLALAQLAWTLRQVPGIERLRVTVDGSPLNLPGKGTTQSTSWWSQYDPSVSWASPELFGIRDGRVVSLVGAQEHRISGLFGSRDSGLRSVAVDMAAEKVAGVTTDGSRVLVAPRSRPTTAPPDPSSASVAYSGGADVLRPAWDLYGRLWVLDRRRSGAVLSVVHSGRSTRLTVRGITGQDVKRFLVSRDGTRLVAVVSGRRRDRLVTARVQRDHSGQVLGVLPAVPLPVAAFKMTEIRDLEWRTPGSVAVLTGPTAGRSQVVVARVDGSSAFGDLATNAEIFREDAVDLVTSPAPGTPLYVGTSDGGLFELTPDGRWTATGIRAGLSSPTFVG